VSVSAPEEHTKLRLFPHFHGQSNGVRSLFRLAWLAILSASQRYRRTTPMHGTDFPKQLDLKLEIYRREYQVPIDAEVMRLLGS
jgi:hypothetical protein